MLKQKISLVENWKGIQKYFFNASWLLATQGVRLLAGFFVGLWLARYLGPRKFGIYSYVISFETIFRSIAGMGVGDSLVMKILEHPNKSSEILSSGFILKILGGIFSFVLLLVVLYLFPQDEILLKYILIISPVLLFQAFDVIDAFYISKVKVKDSAKCRILQITISSLIKVYFIHAGFDLVYFIIMGLADMAFYGAMIYFDYRRKYPDFIFKKSDKAITVDLFKKSFPLMVVALSGLLFAKGDQILLGSLADQSTVGLYSSAVRIVEMLSMFFGLTIQSLFPAIVNAKVSDEKLFFRRFLLLSRGMVISAIILACFVSFFAEEIVLLLFGTSYISACSSLRVLSFNIIFITMSLISYRWYISEGLQKVMMIKVVTLAIFNLSLNFILIPKLGMEGAAVSSVISHFIFFFLFEAFFKRTRQCFSINCLIGKRSREA